MSDQCTEERFLRDVANHEMTIIRDEGVNRHIRFKNPGGARMSHYQLFKRYRAVGMTITQSLLRAVAAAKFYSRHG